MNDYLKVSAKPANYSQYPDKTNKTNEKAQAEEKKPEYDVYEQTKEENPEVKRMEEQLERIRTMRFSSKNKPTKKVQHNTADIRARILNSNSSIMVRMALSEAYREMASISVCGSSNGYDSKDAAKALAQIKKVISAGKLKVANLTKEERAELAIRRAKKKLKNHELQEVKRELMEKRRYNRKKERHISGNPKNGGQENNPFDKFAKGEHWNPIDNLPHGGVDVPSTDVAAGDVAAVSPDVMVGDVSIPAGGVDGLSSGGMEF